MPVGCPLGVPYDFRDREMAEVSPVDLRLLAGERAQPQIGLGLAARSQTRDEMAEVVGAATIAALMRHDVEPAGGERRESLQDLSDEGQIGIDPRGTHRPAQGRPAGLHQYSGDGAVV